MRSGMNSFAGLTLLCFCLTGLPTAAHAGSIYLTGHDVLLHDGQSGYDNLIVDWLRSAGTGSEIAATNYSISVVGSGVGSWGWTDVAGFNDRGAKPGFESTTYYDTDDLIGGTALWSDVLSADLLVILSHLSCGGCDLDTNGSNEINAHAAEITTAFNAGLDIWGISGGTLATFYDFLPPGAVASGLPISGSAGFTATAAGVGIGIMPSMINGFPTHNRFVGFDSAFTVFETRDTEVISIGVRDARIGDGGIIPGEPTLVPEPGTFLLLGSGLAVAALYRRRGKALATRVRSER